MKTKSKSEQSVETGMRARWLRKGSIALLFALALTIVPAVIPDSGVEAASSVPVVSQLAPERADAAPVAVWWVVSLALSRGLPYAINYAQRAGGPPWQANAVRQALVWAGFKCPRWVSGWGQLRRCHR